MLLHYQKQGDAGSNILILHGLFGNLKNWRSMAAFLSKKHQVYSVDLRNHGQSFFHQQMDYPQMAQDVATLVQHLNLDSVSIIGHSMGGKVAMYLALAQPQIHVEQLLIIDIAPVCYEHDFATIFQALQAVPLEQIKTRQEADSYLSQYLQSRSIRQFFLLNLALSKGTSKQRQAQAHWLFNLPVLRQNIGQITCFPDVSPWLERGKKMSVLFVAGELSDYILPAYKQQTKGIFPAARFIYVKRAGHWLHAEKPEVLKQIMTVFFEKSRV